METPSQKIMATSSGLMEKYPVSVPMAKGVVNFQSATVREAKYIVAGQRVTVEFMNRVERCQEDGRRKTSKLPDKEYQKLHREIIDLIQNTKHRQYTSSDLHFFTSVLFGPITSYYTRSVHNLHRFVLGFKDKTKFLPENMKPCKVILHRMSERELHQAHKNTQNRKAREQRSLDVPNVENSLEIMEESHRIPDEEEHVSKPNEGVTPSMNLVASSMNTETCNNIMVIEQDCVVSSTVESEIKTDLGKASEELIAVGDKIMGVTGDPAFLTFQSQDPVPVTDDEDGHSLDKENACVENGCLEKTAKRKKYHGSWFHQSRKIRKIDSAVLNQGVPLAPIQTEVNGENEQIVALPFGNFELDTQSLNLDQVSVMSPQLACLEPETDLDIINVSPPEISKDPTFTLDIVQPGCSGDVGRVSRLVLSLPETEKLSTVYDPIKSNESVMEFTRERCRDAGNEIMLEQIKINNMRIMENYNLPSKSKMPDDFYQEMADPCEETLEDIPDSEKDNFRKVQKDLLESTVELQRRKQRNVSHVELFRYLYERDGHSRKFPYYFNVLLKCMEYHELHPENVPSSGHSSVATSALDKKEATNRETGLKLLYGSSLDLDTSELMIRCDANLFRTENQ